MAANFDDIDYDALNALTVDDLGNVKETPYEKMQRMAAERSTGYEPDEEPAAEKYDEPSVKLVGGDTKRPRKAEKYEEKVTGVLQLVTNLAMASPETIPDAAALIMHGEAVATAFGDLAAADARVARGIDWLTSGTDNPYAAAIVATLPLALQILRNHEPVAEAEHRGIKIPFLKRTIKLRFKVKLGRLRNATNDPDQLVNSVFSNAAMQQSLMESGNWDNVKATLTRRAQRRANRAANN